MKQQVACWPVSQTVADRLSGS